MSATGAGYDLSATTFSPDGRVFQVEYAGKAVENSGAALGIRCKDGVVLGAEKSIVSKMFVSGSNRRIHTLDLHAGLVLSGLAADGRQLVNRGRAESNQFRKFYGNEIPGRVLAQRVASFVHMYTLYWYVRPFGCSVLVACYDEANGPELYQIEPSGIVNRYKAAAVGKHNLGAHTELSKIDFESITCREAVKELARIVYKVHDDVRDKAFELELSWVCDESDRKHVLVPADVSEEAIRLAKEAKEKADMDDSSDEDED